MNCSGIDVSSGSPIQVAFEEKILSVTPAASPAHLYLAPGWIDIQVNGFAAVDYNRPGVSHEDIARSLRVLFSTGVTRFYPTVITGPPDDMEGALRNLAGAREALPDGEAMDGFHVEGPHICPDDGPRGAHPLRWVRQPDLDEFRRWQDATRNRVRIVTLSPEWPEAARYIEAIVSEGVVASIGHTNATARQIADAVSAGATLSTHLGNGAHFEMRRHPNYIWDQLAEDRLMASLIVDGDHLPSEVVQTIVRAKTPQRCILVSDLSGLAGLPVGRYETQMCELEILPDGRLVIAGQDQLLAGASQPIGV